MGVLNKYVLGAFTNKVGEVIGQTWHGIPVVKSNPTHVHNPRSKAQRTQRNRMEVVSVFARDYLNNWIRPLWGDTTGYGRAYSRFIQANIAAINADTGIVLSQLIMSRGILLPPEYIEIRSVGTGAIDLVIENSIGDVRARPTDEIFAVIFSQVYNNKKWYGRTGAVRGTEEYLAIRINVNWQPGDFAWVAYRSADRKRTSPAGVSYVEDFGNIVLPFAVSVKNI